MTSLLDFPDLVWNLILGKLDFRSILTLRKVCRDLRNFIDDSNLELHLTSIEFSMEPNKQGRKKEISVYLLASRISHKVVYEEHKKGCMVVYKKKRILLENSDYCQVFCEDMEYLLKRQNSMLASFILNNPDEMFLGLLRRLKGGGESLKTRLFRITADGCQIFETLRLISPRIVKYVQLKFSKPTEVTVDTLDSMYQLRNAEELFTDNLVILGSVTNMVHFSWAEVTVFKVTVDELVYLKETFLRSPNFQGFMLHYKHFADEGISDLRLRILENRKLREAFGRPHAESNAHGEKSWYFRIPESADVLYFHFCYQNCHFKRKILSDVPEDVL